MKKSKIIIPALGILLLSTAASISGSVAWFTANRTIATKVGSFGIGSVDGNLSGVVAGGVGTEVNSEDNKEILFQQTVSSAAQPTALTDGSYDNSTKNLYTDESVETERVGEGKTAGTNTTKFIDLGTEASHASTGKWKAGSQTVSSVTTNYYYGVSWDINLTYEYAAITKDVYVFFDVANSSVTSSNGTAPGIRFCLSTTTKADGIVYAPLQSGTIKNVCKTAETNPGDDDAIETSSPVIKSGDTVAVIEDGTAAGTATANAAYLGTISTSSTSLSIHVVCWLDGLDAAVINSNLGAATFTGKLNFYCRYAA